MVWAQGIFLNSFGYFCTRNEMKCAVNHSQRFDISPKNKLPNGFNWGYRDWTWHRDFWKSLFTQVSLPECGYATEFWYLSGGKDGVRLSVQEDGDQPVSTGRWEPFWVGRPGGGQPFSTGRRGQPFWAGRRGSAFQYMIYRTRTRLLCGWAGRATTRNNITGIWGGSIRPIYLPIIGSRGRPQLKQMEQSNPTLRFFTWLASLSPGWLAKDWSLCRTGYLTGLIT